MNFKEQLKELGFELRENGNHTLAIHDYSDFEVLMFEVWEHSKVNGDKIIAIDKLKLFNPMVNKGDEPVHYVYIDYTLYIDSIESFLKLLELLNYRINVKNI